MVSQVISSKSKVLNILCAGELLGEACSRQVVGIQLWVFLFCRYGMECLEDAFFK